MQVLCSFELKHIKLKFKKASKILGSEERESCFTFDKFSWTALIKPAS